MIVIMSTIQEFSYLRVPEKTYSSPEDGSTGLPGSSFLKHTAFSVKASKHLSGWEVLDDASNVLSNIGKGTQFGEWINGELDNSPFQEKGIWEVKSNVQSLWQQFSSSLFAQTVVQTILIANSYLEYFSFLQNSDKACGTSFIWDIMVPGAKLYAGAQKALSGIQMINSAENKKIAERGYGTLLSGASDALYSAAKIGAIYLLFKLSPLAELGFMTTSYLGSIIELSRDKEAAKAETLDEMVCKQPTAMILV